jgi:Sulfatase
MTSAGQIDAIADFRALRATLPAPCPPLWEDLAVALSLTNLCFLRSWGELWIGGRPEYLTRTPAGSTLELATLASVVLLGVALFAGFRLFRRFRRRRSSLVSDALVSFAFFCVLLKTLTDPDTLVLLFGPSAMDALLNRLSRLSGFLGVCGCYLTVVLVCFGTLAALLRRPAETFRSVRKLVVILSPWFVINAAQTLWRLNAHSGGYFQAEHRRTTREMPVSRRANRVVWLVFDELDQHLAFEDRPDSIELPEFDAFRGQALVATNASAPEANTLESMPSLITGRLVAQAVPDGPGELRLRFADGEQGAWSRESNVFNAARQLGFKAALAGWYHPYCSVLADSLDECFSVSAERWVPSRRFSSYSQSIGFWKTLFLENSREFSLGATYQRFDGVVFSDLDRRLSTDMRAAHLAAFLEFRNKALDLLADPELTFVCLHVPVPHAPGIFNRETDSFSLAESANYLDNLELADRFLGEVRRALTEAGDWDDATVLVTSDHPYRPALWSREPFWTTEMAERTAHRRLSTIPFLLKLPRQKASRRYVPAFNTVVTRDLLSMIMHGEIRSAEQVSRRLDDHRAAPGPLLVSRN